MFDWFKSLFKSKHRKQVASPTPGYNVQVHIGGKSNLTAEELAEVIREVADAPVRKRTTPRPAPTRNRPGYNPSGDSYNAFYSTNVSSSSYDSGYSSSSCSDSGSSSSGSDSSSSGGGSDC